MARIRTAFIGDPAQIVSVYGTERMEQVAAISDLAPDILSRDTISHAREVEVLLSTWGMPELTLPEVDQLPNLRLVLYAAGDVRGFAGPLFERGIQVSSAWRANAVPVVEFTLAHILLAGKNYLGNCAEYRLKRVARMARTGVGNNGETVGILGAGAIGQQLIQRLKSFDLDEVVFDPWLPDDASDALGVRLVPLEDVFDASLVVTNHLVDNELTRGLLTGDLFERMRPGATFINTGRGKTIQQDEFLDVFRSRPDLTAILDVTDPEPLTADSPLWDLPNVYISTHIAGSQGNELGRMADICLEELERFVANQPLMHLVPPYALIR